ncbi:MAG: peptide chain release factor 2 [Clostridiales bacterium]
MLEELKPQLAEGAKRLKELRRSLDVEQKLVAVAEMEQQTLAPGFWEERETAQALLAQINQRKEAIADYQRMERHYNDAVAMYELAMEEDDPELAREAEKDFGSFTMEMDALDLSLLLSGEYDDHNAIIALHAGAGGLEAQDWTEMLYRMFTRYCEKHHYKVEIIDSLPADEGGFKSITIGVVGKNAYGYLKSERGVHRLVRISPYDAAGRRHTSFASVDVLPQVADDHDVEIDSDDLRIDTYRSSGKGGQHINKTDSAVRITHLPTGIVVQCQDERSQFANKDRAMQLRAAKLLDLKLREREAQLAALRGEQQEIGWGSQIRSYVFQPYRLVKDHRTGFEMGNTDAVMDGELDGFIAAYLRKFAIKA